MARVHSHCRLLTWRVCSRLTSEIERLCSPEEFETNPGWCYRENPNSDCKLVALKVWDTSTGGVQGGGHREFLVPFRVQEYEGPSLEDLDDDFKEPA